jgi:tetratricopeptide (TPR) repeat protein
MKSSWNRHRVLIWFPLTVALVLLPTGKAVAQNSPAATVPNQTASKTAADASQAVPLLSLKLVPGIDIPLGASTPVFGLGGGLRVGVDYRLPFLPIVYVGGGLGYDYDTATHGVANSVSVTSASLGGGVRFPVTPWLSATAGITGGYFFSFLNDFSTSAGNPFVSAEAGVVLLPSPWHVNVGASYLYYFGLYSGLSASVGLSYDLGPSRAASPVKVLQPPPVKAQPLNQQPVKQPPQKPSTTLELKELSFDDIYPVFHTYYDTHPLGKVVLSNTTGKPISGIKVSFQIKEFMADAKECPAPADLGSGESKSVDLFGLFLPTILETTEKTKTQARVDVEYTLAGQVQHQSLVQSIPILDRNATTWADNQRAAAFVTTKDPAVLTFSKNVNSMVKGMIKGAVNPNLLTAIALFQALQLYGLTYSQDPIPTITTSKQVADYIQFPRQTLQYKGGKCSDFSVLYTALLESLGIETAFITIPGHIFIAFSTAVSPDEARKSFSRADNLIFRNEKSWIPVEVTESAGFLQAWQDGAKEWRENLSRKQADFYPLHDAWQSYEPVGLPGAEVTVTLPPSEKIVNAYQGEAGKFVDQEIFPRVADFENQIAKVQDPRKPMNDLGVLYAKYGQYDRAQKEFAKLLAKEDYVPALLNMGHLLYLSDQKEKALDYYDRALAKDPKNPRVLLAVAKASHDLEDYFRTKKAYAELKLLDPDLALQFAYLDLKGEESTRAANEAGVNGIVVWEE